MKSIWLQIVSPTLYLGLLLVLAPLSLGAYQDPETEAEARAAIEAINREIATLEGLITSQSAERDALQRQLRKTDLDIGRTNNALRKTQKNLDKRQRQINTLEAQGIALERKIEDRQASIESALGVFSVLKQGGDLKILFGDSSPQDTERHLAYFNILLEQQLDNIDSFKTAVTNLEVNRAQLLDKQAEQQRENASLARLRERLLAERGSQRKVIQSISTSLSRDGAQVAALRNDAVRLNTLLTELLERLANLALGGEFADFTSLEAKLRAPIDGASQTRFGQKRERGDLKWQGWLIPAERGSAVRSVHHGRVIYADWLRGQGLLTIIDHGDGWMSLYGHNESLLKESGEWVAPGEVIARVGSSGGAPSPALYFEIRSNGVPVDPANWIR